MRDDRHTQLHASGLRIGLAVSRYHSRITEALRDGAVQAFLDAGGHRGDLVIFDAPGAFELTAICSALASRGDLDAIVAIGCVITGETPHDQYICQAVAGGLTQITVQTGVPVSFGVLTCLSLEQAHARAGGAKGNKGAEAMLAAIAAAATIRVVRNTSPGHCTNRQPHTSEAPIDPFEPTESNCDAPAGPLNRNVRRCALQLLYQFDAGNADTADSARLALAEAPYGESEKDRASGLADCAWRHRAVADTAIAALTPDWPTHRQPVVDRSILRLAHYEMASGLTPPKVAINEAVELAKEFSTERSPMFINGVLDRLYKSIRGPHEGSAAPPPRAAI